MRCRVSAEAQDDLDRIFAYWAERVSVETADRLVGAIVDRFGLLTEYPDSGRRCDELAPGVRCFPAGKYLIYYRKVRGAIEIIHVFHGARDQKRAFRSVSKVPKSNK